MGGLGPGWEWGECWERKKLELEPPEREGARENLGLSSNFAQGQPCSEDEANQAAMVTPHSSTSG